jgi:L-fuconolactonase
MAGIIDTHVHVVSQNTGRYPQQVNASATHRWWSGGNCDTAALLANMDAHGVAAALAVQAVGVYAYDNAYLLHEVSSESGTVAGVVAVDMDADGPAEEIARMSSLPGVAGVRLFAVSPGSSWIHSGKADEAFDAAARADLPVVLTAFEHQLPPLLPSIARYTTLRIAVDHCAFPTLEGTRISNASPLLELVGARNVTMKISSHVLLHLPSPEAPPALVDDLVSRFGTGRVMWGSDWPQTPLADYGAHLELAQRAVANLTEGEQSGLMGANAEAWLGSRFLNRVGRAEVRAARPEEGEHHDADR